MSKRKILTLVNEGYVLGWDDAKLYTLIALRRRGVPPGAITSFVSTLGVSTAAPDIEAARFKQAIRQYLENSGPRLLMVMRPLGVTISNLPEDYVLMIEKPLHLKVPELGSTTVPLTRTVYIDRDGFRLEDSKDFYRLALGKTAGIFQAPHPTMCMLFKTDPESGGIVELICTLEDGAGSLMKKPKAFVQCVAQYESLGRPVRIDETRIFHWLFKTHNPPSGYKSELLGGRERGGSGLLRSRVSRWHIGASS
jgi:glutaminyl-tRNA synthetase